MIFLNNYCSGSIYLFDYASIDLVSKDDPAMVAGFREKVVELQ